MTKVTAIIPAFNETATIGEVVHILMSSPDIEQVLVISDGSVDQTAFVARQAGAIVHELFPNKGKGEAMRFGLSQTDAEIVVFFDADLLCLTLEHVRLLLLPVITGKRMMNVGLMDRGSLLTALFAHLPLISGQRAMKREVFEGVPSRFLRGFMVETALNYFCRSRKYSYGSVKLSGLSIIRKYEKVGFTRAVLQYIRMFYQIVMAMVIVRISPRPL